MYLYCQKRERFLNLKTLRHIIRFHKPYKDPADPDSGIFIFQIWDLMIIYNQLKIGASGLKSKPGRFSRAKAKAEKARRGE